MHSNAKIKKHWLQQIQSARVCLKMAKEDQQKNTMCVDDNLMANTQEYLRPALAASAEALFMLLDYPDEN